MRDELSQSEVVAFLRRRVMNAVAFCALEERAQDELTPGGIYVIDMLGSDFLDAMLTSLDYESKTGVEVLSRDERAEFLNLANAVEKAYAAGELAAERDELRDWAQLVIQRLGWSDEVVE